MERHAAAILIADVVGYSRLMRLDDEGTRRAFQALDREVFQPTVAAHGGRIVKTMGDAFLIEFPSAAGAVAAAIELQDKTGEHQKAVADDRRLRFRFGINHDDVIVEGDDIHGDGVNVAARLEPIARPGGICLSEQVVAALPDEMRLDLDDGGRQNLKNINEPIRVYHLGGDANAPTSARDSNTKFGSGAKPLVGVPPIKVIGRGNDDITALAEGLRDVILSGLATFTAIEVARDPDEMRIDFRLEGNVRGAGGRIRASFALYDLAKGTEVWAQQYDRTLDDIFELEDEISQSVVSVVRVRLKALELERLEATDNASLNVAQLLSRTAGIFVNTSGRNDEGQDLLDLALAKEPDNSMAHAMFALCQWRRHEFSPKAVPESDRDLIRHHAERAVKLDAKSYFALLMAAVAQEEIAADYRAALSYAELALEINPGFTQAQGAVGIAHCHLGDRERGLRELRRAYEANKDDPYRFRHQREIALALTMEAQYEDAAQVARRLIRQAPDLCRNGVISAGIYWLAGAKDDARDCMAELLRRYPDLNRGNMRDIHFPDAAMKRDFIEALSKAGLPDGA